MMSTIFFMFALGVFSSMFWEFLFFLFVLFFLFFIKYPLSISYLSCFMGVDMLSFSLCCLSIWVSSLMVLASGMLKKSSFFSEFFIWVLLGLLISLFLTFSSLNLFIFYLFFEISLIPTFILIIGWGNQPERLLAGVYLLFYTLLASLPMLAGLFYLKGLMNTLDFYFLADKGSFFLYLCINLVFFVKIPMFIVHLWLPKAHVEAPISGSMILAGIMLKLGGYGLLRFMKMFLSLGTKLNFFFILIFMVGAVVISLVCVRQSDLKMLIAYSSVAHMGVAAAGILTLNLWGAWGGLLMMLAHGLSSSGLFCLANISYERTHSRSFFLNKGLMQIMPSLSLWWFLLCSSNMAAPPSLNLMSEIILMVSVFLYSKIFLIVLFFLAFYGAVYSLFLYSFTQHGKFYLGLYSFYLVSVREFLLVFLHWVPLNLLFLKPEFLLWI
uniref:NADH-ubiquinone oxidoreductase chain 4 n=1 Tax=Hypothenemus sp. BMNH 1040235 TaxID=1903787 RepID=A0A343A623_9CUCU|nr:NADH dehydrogenase subunit 4 [Hypothenemus sp. BMNH 1040235]